MAGGEMSDEKPMIGRCLNCDAKFELSNSAAMDVIRERDKLSAELAELKHKFDEQYSHDTKALNDVHRERDELKAEVEKFKAAHKYLSTTAKRDIGEIVIERDALKAKLERAKARFIEIENLDPIHERERRTIAREGRKEIEGKP